MAVSKLDRKKENLNKRIYGITKGIIGDAKEKESESGGKNGVRTF